MTPADHNRDGDASKTDILPPALEWHDGDMPFSPQFQDHFYSKADGRAECDHVFISGNNLDERWISAPHFCIGELGFGTGLNLCQTWHRWKQQRIPGAQLEFTSFERFPMTRDEITKALAHWPEIASECSALTEHWPDDPKDVIEIALDEQTRLTVICGDALAGLSQLDARFDAWFLDGFAPSRNPEMWSLALMQSVYDHTEDGGTFATYTVAGFVRRNLTEAGFAVEKRKGFAGKREMLAGRKPS